MAQPSSSEPTVVITMTDVYLKLCRLEEKVNDVTSQGKTITDHESRLRGLERWKYTLPTSLLLAVVSVVIAVIEAKP